jgi:hypothetical protein
LDGPKAHIRLFPDDSHAVAERGSSESGNWSTVLWTLRKFRMVISVNACFQESNLQLQECPQHLILNVPRLKEMCRA